MRAPQEVERKSHPRCWDGKVAGVAAGSWILSNYADKGPRPQNHGSHGRSWGVPHYFPWVFGIAARNRNVQQTLRWSQKPVLKPFLGSLGPSWEPLGLD